MRFVVLILFAFCLIPTHSEAKEIIVVIDAGHGGDDPGHLPNNSNLLPEKDLNLKIAQYFGSYIEKYLQNIKVVYTRTDDSFSSLDDRVNKANNAKADYFISIHCNGNERKSVHGTESHVHSMDLKNSVSLAKSIENQFSRRAGRKSRGVKDKRDLQHSLQVLKFTNMTSVLVECGFVTNDAEASFLNTSYGQEIIASAIFRGFRETAERDHPETAFRKPANSSNTNNTTTASTEKSSNGYAIQIASSKNPIDPKNDPGLRKSKMDVTRKELNTTSSYKYIYLVGDFISKEEADETLETIKKRGFKDAIVVKQ